EPYDHETRASARVSCWCDADRCQPATGRRYMRVTTRETGDRVAATCSPPRSATMCTRTCCPAATPSSGVPAIRFHVLRPPSAPLLLAEGVHGKIVQERLGHANIAMTLDLYSHVTADMQRHAADRLDAVLEDASQSA